MNLQHLVRQNDLRTAAEIGLVSEGAPTQFKEFHQAAKHNYEANKAFHDAYLTPKSTEHIVDDQTISGMHSVNPAKNTMHTYQPWGCIQRVRPGGLRDVKLGIDTQKPPRARRPSYIDTASQKAVPSGFVASMFLPLIGSLTGGIASAGVASAAGTVRALQSMYHANNAKQYIDKNDALPGHNDLSRSPHRHRLLIKKAHKARIRMKNRELLENRITPRTKNRPS